MSPYRDVAAAEPEQPRPTKSRWHWWTRLRRRLMSVGKKRWGTCASCLKHRRSWNLCTMFQGLELDVCNDRDRCMRAMSHLKWS